MDLMIEYVHGMVTRRRLSSYFLLKALFSGKVPCMGIRPSRGNYLMIYNLSIALLVFVLGGIIASGMSPEKVDHFRNKYRVAISLITGLTLLALAPLITVK